ncbi:MAG: hypothetical protein AAB449_01855 [Patescibacteria group bacterium]
MSLERPQAQESVVLKPERIEAPGGSKVEFIPQRGGLVASFRPRGREALYMDKGTLTNPRENVRGGIPILFPNAGPIKNPLYPNLPQHGFARGSSAWESTISPDKAEFTEWLHSSEETLAMYPYKFLLEMNGRLDENMFTLTQSVTNLEEENEMPVAFGLHPYFPVRNADKSKITFEFPGGEVLEEKKAEWMQGKAVSIDNPKAYALNAEMRVRIPGLGTLILEASPEYKKIWMWSLPGQDFVCIEPVMRDSGGLVDDPMRLQPAEIYSAKFSIKLER